MNRERVSTSDGPQAIGPYSQAIAAGELVFVSGQIPIDPATGELIEGGIEEQTDRAMKNLKAIIEAAGSSMSRVVKTTVYITDMDDFQAMNGVYGRYFEGDEPPARAAIQAGRLPKGVSVEIEAIALKS